MTKDHKVPKAHGGNKGANLVDCCMICNRAKGCLTVEQFVKWANDVSSYTKDIVMVK
jgi:5-methylcytosine-specific restriction endonuclease McrA